MKTVEIISYELTRYFQSEMDHVRKLSHRKSLPILFEFTDASTHRQSQLRKAMQTIQSQGPYLIVVPSMSRLASDQRKLYRYVLQILKSKSSIYFVEERLTFTPSHLKSIKIFQSWFLGLSRTIRPLMSLWWMLKPHGFNFAQIAGKLIRPSRFTLTGSMQGWFLSELLTVLNCMSLASWHL